MDYDDLIRLEVLPLVAYRPGMRASEVRDRCGLDSISKLSSNESPFGPVDSAVHAMTAVLGRLNSYPDGSARALKAALSAHVGVEQELLVVGNGSNELIRVIAEATLRPDDEVVFAWPSFIVYPTVAKLMGAVPVAVPLTEDASDLGAMLAAITDKTRLVFLCNPNNPTGTIYSDAEFRDFLDRVPSHVLVVADEAYFEFVDDPSYPNALNYFDGERPLVVLRTFSKIYGLAGARVGYGAAPRPVVEAMDKVRDPFNVNTVAQVGAAYSLYEQPEILRRRAVNARERSRLCRALDELGLRYAPSQTNFVWTHHSNPSALFEALLARGVITRLFADAEALRIGVGTAEDTDRTVGALVQAIAELGV